MTQIHINTFVFVLHKAICNESSSKYLKLSPCLVSIYGEGVMLVCFSVKCTLGLYHYYGIYHLAYIIGSLFYYNDLLGQGSVCHKYLQKSRSEFVVELLYITIYLVHFEAISTTDDCLLPVITNKNKAI